MSNGKSHDNDCDVSRPETISTLSPKQQLFQKLLIILDITKSIEIKREMYVTATKSTICIKIYKKLHVFNLIAKSHSISITAQLCMYVYDWKLVGYRDI